MQSTIAHIFRGAIGDAMAVNAISHAIAECDDVVKDMVAATPKLSWVGSSAPGTAGTPNNNVSGTLFNDGFKLIVNQHGYYNYTIDIGTDMEIKKVASTPRKDISVRYTGQLGHLISKDSALGSTLAYNTIAHGALAGYALAAVKGGYAASFVQEMMERIAPQPLFIMVGGHVYSVFSLVVKICDEYMTTQSSSAIDLHVEGVQNRWVGTRPSYLDAMQRSRMV